MRAIENVVRAVLREAGLKLGTPARTAFAGRVRELAGDDRAVMPIVQPLLAILDTMLAELARLTKQVLGLARKEEVCRRLMTVPGVGPITALTFRATIDQPDRFRRSRDVGAHLGLTPARISPARPTSPARSADVVTNSPAPPSTKPPTRCWCAAANGPACVPGA